MAMARQIYDQAKSSVEIKGHHETYAFQWTIPNWEIVRTDQKLVDDQKITFEASQQARWVIGLKAVPVQGSYRARVYFKLVETNGHTRNLDVTVCTQLLDARGEAKTSDEKHKIVSLNDTIEETSEYLDVLTTKKVDGAYIHSDGSVKFSLKLITKLPPSASDSFNQNYSNEFLNKSLKRLCDNQAGLLVDETNADLKIVTREESVIRAHKTILIAQCPVFASMLTNEFCEHTSGVVKLDDISEKTMKILLQYFYTGNLSPSWSDLDTVVEFVYAAGKYQMILVLELLDNTLGRNAQQQASYVDVQLLNWAEKLSLKHAEIRLLHRVIETVLKVKTSQDLFELFGYHHEDISKEAELLGCQMFGESNVLEILDAMLGDHDNEQLLGAGKMVPCLLTKFIFA